MGNIEAGDETAVDRLLPLLYDELRRLASQQLSNEKPGQFLNATALVHEAYFKLLGDQKFESRRHFLVPPLKPCDEFLLIAHERGNRSAGS